MAKTDPADQNASAPVNYTIELLESMAARGDRDAVVLGSERITYREACDLVLRLSRALRDADMGPGKVLGMFTANRPEALLLQIAAHFTGCRLVFVPPEPGDSELAAFVQRAGVDLLVFDPAFEERVERITGRVRVPMLFSLGKAHLGWNLLDALAFEADLTPADAADAAHVSTLFYTGGTTGRPKLVVHKGRYYDVVSPLAERCADGAPDPKFLVATLLTHTSGHLGALAGLRGGFTILLMEGFDGGAALSLMERERVTTMVLVPPMLYEILDDPACATARTDTLRRIFYTGAATAPARLRAAIERFGPVMHQFYGTTEAAVITDLAREEHDLARPRTLESCGRPLPGVEVELRNGGSVVTGPGAVGEIHVCSDMVMSGYWNDLERSEEVLQDGWYRTGDLAYRDEEGYLYLVDRAKDIIVTGRTSDNVYSRLLDDFLCTLPEIRLAAAIGVPDEAYGEAVHVYLVPRPNTSLDLDDVRRRVVEELGGLYEPKSFSIVDALPTTAVGKIDKAALRRRFALRTGDETGDELDPVR